MNSDSPRRRWRFLSLVPRYNLRTLLIAVLLLAVLFEVIKLGWPRVVQFFEARQYASLQATKDDFVAKQRQEQEALGNPSFAVDDGRPIPDGFVILVRVGTCSVASFRAIKE